MEQIKSESAVNQDCGSAPLRADALPSASAGVEKPLSDILNEARQRIADASHWTKGRNARDNGGAGIFALSGRAVSWCAMGSLMRSCGADPDLNRRAENLLTDAAERVYKESVVYVNDEFGHAAILAVYDYAIAKASPAGQATATPDGAPIK